MKLKIAVLAGDGIGPEIMEQGVAVCNAVAEKFGHEVSYKEAICGAHAIDEVGDPFPEETFQTCMDADAVLFVPTGALANYNVQPWTEWFSRIEEKAFFEDEDAIREVESSKLKVESSWFDLSGRKLAGKPTKAGLYINGGKKIVVK